MWRKPFVQQTIGSVLIVAGLTVAVIWFVWLVPSVLRSDPLWHEQFTRKAYWEHLQKQIHRYGWRHADFGPVGHYGDKSWAVWILTRAQAGQSIASCGDVGHKDSALEMITCSDPARGTNSNSETQWLSWWSTNHNRSQLERIQEGLKKYNVAVRLPPSPADWEPLLAMLGQKQTNAHGKIPEFAKCNAFRWLRDSGFEPLSFALTNVTPQTSSPVVEGLVEYRKLELRFPKSDGTGILAFAGGPPESDRGYRLAFFQPGIQIGGYALMILPFTAGAGLVLNSFRRGPSKRREVGNNNAGPGADAD